MAVTLEVNRRRIAP